MPPCPAAQASLALRVDDAPVRTLDSSTAEDAPSFASFRLSDDDARLLGGAGHKYALEMRLREAGDVEEGAPLLVRDKIQTKASLMGLTLDMLLKKLRMLDSDGTSQEAQQNVQDQDAALSDKMSEQVITVPDDLVAHLRLVGWEEHLKVLKSANQRAVGAHQDLGVTVTCRGASYPSCTSQ